MADIKFRFITFARNGVPHVRMTDPPHIMAQVIKIKDQRRSNEYGNKFQVRSTCQVPGLNVFLTHSGFHQKPGRFIKQEEVDTVIKQMCDWYASSVPLSDDYKIKISPNTKQ